MKNSFFLNSLTKDSDSLFNIYNKIKNSKDSDLDVDDLKHLDFLKTYYAINSRNFTLPGLNKKAIIPCGDFFNFNPTNTNIVFSYDKDNKEFIIRAIKDIKKGEELNLDYGDHSNRDLLKNYGFSLDDNSRNTNSVEIDLESNDKLVLAPSNYGILENSKKIIKKRKNAMHNIILYTLYLRDILNNYPTTLKQDLKKLRKMREGENNFCKTKRDILRILADEKRTVLGGFQIGNAIIYLLSSPDDEKIKEKISHDVLKIIKENSNLYKKELDKYKISVKPVEDYSVYERNDVLEYLNHILEKKR